MPYWKCYYHLVWATKHREAVILPAFEVVIYEAICEKAQAMKCTVLAVNGVSDHVHVAIAIAPHIAVSTCIGNLKGASSRAVNSSFDRELRFHWQDGYGAMTFGEKALPDVIEYIRHQKERHTRQELNWYLERVEE